MYSKPRLLMQSIMKSLPLLPSVKTSNAGGTWVSAALLVSGTGLRAGAACVCAAAFSGAANAAAPASPAPFKNPRRPSLTSFCFDICDSPGSELRLAAILGWSHQGVDNRRGAKRGSNGLQFLVRFRRQLDAHRVARLHLARGPG